MGFGTIAALISERYDELAADAAMKCASDVTMMV